MTTPALALAKDEPETEAPMSIDFDSILSGGERKRPKIEIVYDYNRVTSPPPPPRRKVAFSGLSPDKRSSYPKLVTSLGGEVSTSTTGIDPETTHLVISTLAKSEKFLSACAAGCWILRPEWIEACEREGRFLPEMLYEWTPTIINSTDAKNGRAAADSVIERLPQYWRERKRYQSKRAFDGWHVLLAADQKRVASFKAILALGGAIVHLHTDFDTTISLAPVESITHLLYSTKNMRARIPEAILSRLPSSVHEHPVDYLADYLFTTH